jgi:hypothetical protein
MKTSSKKAKGRGLQYWVAEKVAWLFDKKFVYADDLCPVKSRGMGQQGNDVFITDSELFKKFPFAVECKCTETVSLYAYIEQVKANAKEGQPWLVIHKKNRSKPVVILDAEYFFDMLKQGVLNVENKEQSQD